jgi:putative endonuclease
MTNNLPKRLQQHKVVDDSEKFTARYNVNLLLYYERYQDVRQAIAREKEIKGWRREKKIRLIESTNPYWKILNEEEV